MTATVLIPGVLWIDWCSDCQDRRQFDRAGCLMRRRHADKVCACGRPCASERCSECAAKADLS